MIRGDQRWVDATTDPTVRELTVLVSRATNGAATTVPLTLVDDRGEWQTLVGGGATAF